MYFRLNWKQKCFIFLYFTLKELICNVYLKHKVIHVEENDFYENWCLGTHNVQAVSRQFWVWHGTQKFMLMFFSLRGESHIDFRMHCIIMTQRRWPPTPVRHMRHSQNLHKIDSFLKPVWNIFILRNLVVGLGKRNY